MCHVCLLGYEVVRSPLSFSAGPRQKRSGSAGHAVRESPLWSGGSGDKSWAVNYDNGSTNVCVLVIIITEFADPIITLNK